MRRISTCLAVLGLAVLGLSATASAAPTITFKAKAVPIPGFPHTGNILGAGAAVQTRIHDLRDRIRWLPAAAHRGHRLVPAGVKLHPQGFATCARKRDQGKGPQRVPEEI